MRRCYESDATNNAHSGFGTSEWVIIIPGISSIVSIRRRRDTLWIFVSLINSRLDNTDSGEQEQQQKRNCLCSGEQSVLVISRAFHDHLHYYRRGSEGT
jgi:hypothetical protein